MIAEPKVKNEEFCCCVIVLSVNHSFYFDLVSFRLERLQRVFGKVQMESGVCDDQLSRLESLLQSVRSSFGLTQSHTAYYVQKSQSYFM